MTPLTGRPRTFPPRKHVHRNEERVWWGDRWYSLGPIGSPKAKAEYLRLVALWQDDPYAVPDRADDYLVPELFRDYLATDPAEPEQVRRAGELLAELHLRTPVDTFGGRDLSAWQTWLCERKDGKGRRLYAKGYVVKLVGIVRRVFRWAVATERVPVDRYEALRTVRGPRPGQARTGRVVRPVSEDDFAAALPFLPASLRALAMVQRLTGARPSELIGLTPSSLDRSSPVWSFSPSSHKTAARGHARTLYFGPKAQAVLLEHWPPSDDGLFFPVREQGRAPRKAKLWPSHVARYVREKARRQRAPVGQAYTAGSYRAAVKRACGWAGVTAWTPYQLRHSRLTEVRAASGLEAAQAVGGHATIAATQLYAGRRDELAAKAARETG